SAIKLSLLQDIGQKVDDIKKNQELTLVLEGALARQTMDRIFSAKLPAILVYLHIPDFNQSKLAAEVNRRYKAYDMKLTQPRISVMLPEMKEVGLLLPAKKPAYQPAWRKFLLAQFLRRQLPTALRPKLKKELDRLNRA